MAIESADGARTSATVFAAASAAAPVILICPAMGTPAKFYTPYAEALASQGTHAVVMDLRGIGTSSLRASRRVNFGYREMVELDFPAAVAAVRARFATSPILLLGHSLGGQLAALHLARQPEQVSGLILIACGNVYYRGWPVPMRWGFLAFTQFAALVSLIAGYFPGKKFGFGGTEARGVILDWARCARNGRYRPDGAAINYEEALARCTLPVLGISFEGDNFAPRQATQNLVGKLVAAPVTHLHLSTAETANLRIDHYKWVKSPAITLQRVHQWLAEIC